MQNKKNYHFWNEEEIKSSIERFIQKKGRMPRAREMNIYNDLPSRKTFKKITGSSFYDYGKQYYPELVELNRNLHIQRVVESRKDEQEWSIERLLEAVKEFVNHYGRIPYPTEYDKKYGLPTYATFHKLAEIHLNEYFMEQFLEEEMKQSNDIEIQMY